MAVQTTLGVNKTRICIRNDQTIMKTDKRTLTNNNNQNDNHENNQLRQVAFEMGIPMPLKVLLPVWGTDNSTLARWARNGHIPGAHKVRGQWWFYPKLLVEPPVEVVQPVKFANANEPIQRRRTR